MKKQVIIAKLSAVLMATFTITSLFAQDQNGVATSGIKMPQTIGVAAFALEPALTPASSTVFVKAKVMRSFFELFADATDVKWTTANSLYFASFVQNGYMCKALFDNRGGLVYSMKYGTEKDLPRDARKLLKSTYLDYTINVVTELVTGDSTTWIVNLSDADSLIVARVHNGDLQELQHYKTHF
jgi:hypothetical protein